jgi:hypothetical protein
MTNRKSKIEFGAITVCAALVMFSTGCSSEPPTAAVSGTVTLKGQPLAHGRVAFLSEDGRTATAVIENGKYNIPNVPVGKVKAAVTVPSSSDTATANQVMKKMGGMAKMMQEKGISVGGGSKGEKAIDLPKKYQDADSSGLNFEVKRGSNTFNIEMN